VPGAGVTGGNFTRSPTLSVGELLPAAAEPEYSPRPVVSLRLRKRLEAVRAAKGSHQGMPFWWIETWQWYQADLRRDDKDGAFSL
jgi:hypothetical protein